MAELRVEKKKNPIWPWIIIGLIILGLIIYFLVLKDTDTDTETDAPAETEQVSRDPVENTTVAAYVNFIQADTNQMGIDHEFTNEALLRLTNATKAIADEVGVDVERDLSVVRENAKEITQDPFETTHANKIRRSADKLSDALQTIQQAEFPDLDNEANNLRNASGSINPEVLTLDQRDEVKSFFDQAADLLASMNTQPRQRR